MHSFKDNKGREWKITIAVDEVEAIQDACGIDFGKIENFGQLLGDTKRFKQIVWALIHEQAKAQELTDKQVMNGFDAVVVEDAVVAISEEMLLFFRNPPHVMRLKTAVENRAKFLRGEAEGKLDELNQRIESGKMDKFLLEPEKLLDSLNGAIDLPALLESTPVV